MEELDVLKQTRAIVAESWTRGNYRSGGRHCLVGAINTVTGTPVQTHSESDSLRRTRKVRRATIAGLQRNADFGSLESFNDRYGKQEVLRLLDERIATVEASKKPYVSPVKEDPPLYLPLGWDKKEAREKVEA